MTSATAAASRRAFGRGYRRLMATAELACPHCNSRRVREIQTFHFIRILFRIFGFRSVKCKECARRSFWF